MDQLSTVREIIDDGATSINHYEYDSYGHLLAQSSSAVVNDLLFARREFDASGTGYFRTRCYSPDIGRFSQEDLLSPWSYAQSVGRDPFGLDIEEGWLTAYARTLATSILKTYAEGTAFVARVDELLLSIYQSPIGSPLREVQLRALYLLLEESPPVVQALIRVALPLGGAGWFNVHYFVTKSPFSLFVGRRRARFLDTGQGVSKAKARELKS